MRVHVYILASGRNGTLYVGVTRDLARRHFEHRGHAFATSFTARYGVHRLVWAEEYALLSEAIAREKQIKKWKRAWKIALIEEVNPTWRDLSGDLL